MEPAAGPAAPSRCHRHLRAFLSAVLAILLVTAGVEVFVRLRLSTHLDRFTLTMPPVKLTGNVLPKAVFRSPGMLPIYGSSELDRPADNRPDSFFLHRPTGFAAFPIGRADNTSLIILQKLAAAGSAVRGKKVAVILSASWFLRSLDDQSLDANLRPLQLGSWIFGRNLSTPLKRAIARRMLTYPQTLEGQPTLRLALQSLSRGSAFNRTRLALLTPVGRLQNFVLGRVEYWALLHDMASFLPSSRQREQERRRRFLTTPTAPPDWDALATRAEARERAANDSDPYSAGDVGLGNAGPELKAASPVTLNPPPPPDHDDDFLRRMNTSGEWADLNLLLRGLRELGADALIIDQPFNGLYSDAGGNSAQARQQVYDRLAKAVHAAGFPFVELAGHERDKYFFNDYNHPSAKGWLFYDHALDDFYHGRGEYSAVRSHRS